MQIYKDLLHDILDNGKIHHNRTGVDTIRVFGLQFRHDLSQGFPLLTTKKMFAKGMIHELLWFLRGDTNIKYLNDNSVNFWNAWADENGDLGPIYGAALRKWETYRFVEPCAEVPSGIQTYEIDQVANLITEIKKNPESRRLILSTWNVGRLDQMRLPPCHGLTTQFVVMDGKLNCSTLQRSADFPVGVPVNIASYALLTHMIAHVCGLEPGTLVYNFNDSHIYLSQMPGVREQLTRDPLPLPTLCLEPSVKNIDDFKFDDIKIVNYVSHPKIKFDVAI